MSTQPLARRWRIASILIGFGLAGASGWCLLTGRGGLLGVAGKLFYPGLLLTLVIMRSVTLYSIVTAFLMNAILYVLVAFFAFRLARR